MNIEPHIHPRTGNEYHKKHRYILSSVDVLQDLWKVSYEGLESETGRFGFRCRLCEKQMEWWQVTEHIQMRRHITARQRSGMEPAPQEPPSQWTAILQAAGHL